MPESKKIVVKVDVHDNKGKKKALKAVSSLGGIESIAMDMKDQKLTVIGAVDPVDIIGRLKKLSHAEILTVGPAKEEKKDGEKKKEDGKKDGEKKDEKVVYNSVYPYYYVPQPYYHVHSVEENPNGCVIC